MTRKKYPKFWNHPKRVKIVEKRLILCRKGDCAANMLALKGNSSKLVAVCQSKDKEGDHSEYYPCTSCYGFYHSKSLFKQLKICQFRTTDNLVMPLASSRAMLHTELTDGKVGDVHFKIISRMTKRGERFLVIKNDATLLQFAVTQMQCKQRDS